MGSCEHFRIMIMAFDDHIIMCLGNALLRSLSQNCYNFLCSSHSPSFINYILRISQGLLFPSLVSPLSMFKQPHNLNKRVQHKSTCYEAFAVVSVEPRSFTRVVLTNLSMVNTLLLGRNYDDRAFGMLHINQSLENIS